MGLRLVAHCLTGFARPLRQSLGGSVFPGGAWERAELGSVAEVHSHSCFMIRHLEFQLVIIILFILFIAIRV